MPFKVTEIYELFVQEGIKEDLRTRHQVQDFLKAKKRKLNQIRSGLKKFFDKESLSNPYADLRILYGDPQRKVKRVLVGIDIDAGELLLADRLREKGQEIDLVIAHHPEGIGLSSLYDVMHLQADVLVNLGMSKDVAEGIMAKRIEEVARGVHSANHTRAIDAARLLDIPLMCCHTPADNHVAGYLQKLFDRKKPTTLKQVIDILLHEPEYQDAARLNAGPRILVGDADDKAGKVFVDMTGGTEGSKEMFARLSQIGIKTFLGMHLSEGSFQRIKTEYMNVVIAGHMASDNLGMNLLLDKLEKKTDIEIIPCSGFRRFKR